VEEFRVRVIGTGSLAEVKIEIEPTEAAAAGAGDLAFRVSRVIQDTLAFRADVVAVPRGSLPRFEMKAKRFVREQQA
jgi:phenylacetate-CoA ligase